MLSTESIKNVGQAAHYFLEQDNYYLEDAEGKERSEWWGEGAKLLGLSGKINERIFTDLLSGRLPNDQQLGIKVDGELKHRPGFDLTFSVPKSVSIVALLGGDKRIFDAISRATNKVLQQIEQECAKARVTQDRITTYQATQKLVVAKFLHDISREGDPQLHEHAVVMNMTLCPDGKWRSLASQSGDYSAQATQEINGFFERVRHHKLYYGMLFRAELAYELKQLGFSLRKTGQGFFEIEGISQKTIEAYSRRRKQIEHYMEEQGYSGAKAAAMVTLQTRKAKNINRETLQELWQTRSQTHQIDGFGEAKRVVEATLNPQLREVAFDLPPVDKERAREAVVAAMMHLSETQVAISQMELINAALHYTFSESVNLEAIFNAIKEQQEKGELIRLNSTSNQISFTTKRLIEYDQAIIQAVTEKNVRGQPLLPSYKIEGFLAEQSQLTSEQRRAIKTLFSSQEKVMALEGSAGSGKTSLIKPMMELAKLSGYQPILLTPSKANSVKLEQTFRSVPSSLREWFKQLFDSSQYDTIFGFLKKQESHSRLPSKQVIFVDKAMLVGSKQMHDLMKYVQQSKDACLIVIDDPKSLLSWQASTPFLQMLQHGITKATLTQNLRPQPKHIKTAIVDTLKNNIAAAFEKIGHHMIAIENKEQRLEAIAAHFASLTPTEQKDTLVLMPTKQQCLDANEAIREALKQRKVLHPQGLLVEVLLPKNLSEVEFSYAKSYQRGQVVRFNETYSSLRVLKGEYCQVKDIKRERNIVILENAKGKTIVWDPDKVGGKSGKIEVFETQTREVVVGDTLTWQRNDYRKKLHKGERLQVAQINGQRLQLTRRDGKNLWVSMKETQARHFDYGYTSTPYQTADVSASRVIAYQSSFSRQSHQRLFYSTLAQATSQVWLYTENTHQLLNQLQKHTGDKTTALEVLLGGSSEYWVGHSALLQKAVSNAISQLQQQKNHDDKTPEELAREAVQYALTHLAEREAAFEHQDVMKVALKYALGDVESGKIQAAILEAEEKGDLIRGLCSTNGICWTTREASDMEREIVQLAREHQGKLEPIASRETIESHLQRTQPKEEHTKAIRIIASSQDRIVMIQGDAGTGKTTMLKNIEFLLKGVESLLLNQPGQELLCLAPTHTAVKELKARGLEAQTADSFIAEMKSTHKETLPQYQYQRVIAVDESSMLSNRRLHELLKITQLTQTRLLIVGDAKQYPAIESGKPQVILLNSGLTVVYLTDIERQKNVILREAVKHVYKGEFKAAFKTLANHIVEVGQEKVNEKTVDNRDKRLEAISEDYLSRTSIERAQTMIITLGNDDREIINELVREGLKNKGELHGESVMTTILAPRDMTQIERSRSANYKKGDVVRFNMPDKSTGIEKNQYLTVNSIHQKENLLVLQKEDGQYVVWSPSQNAKEQWSPVEIYEKKAREIQAGDLIRWTRTDKARGFLSPELVKVEEVSRDKCLFRQINVTHQGIVPGDLLFEVHPTKQAYQHWDHAYAMTGYSAQGKSIFSVILHLESFRKYLTSQPSVIVMLTRAIEKLIVYTDNKEDLLKVILQNKGEKTSALETMSEWKPIAHSPPEKVSQKKKSPPLVNQAEEKLLDANRITQLLHDQAEQVLERLLGEPKERSGSQWRYGSNKGSFVVTLTGDKRGLWHDFQIGEGGNLLQLIAEKVGLNMKVDFKKVLTQATALLGISENVVQVEKNLVKTNLHKTSSPKLKELTESQKNSFRHARRLVRESQSIKGTIAERYLREHRHIGLEKMPTSFRFHPGIYSSINEAIRPALLVIAKDKEGKVQGVQAIFLDENTGNKADVKVKKQNWGSTGSGGSVDIGDPVKAEFVCLAEGPETGLSIHAAFPQTHVKVTLGKENFKNVDMKAINKPIVLCLDNDGKSPRSEKAIQLAVENLLAEGKQVWVAMPETIKTDYNDLLKEGGIQAVKNNIEHAIPYENYRDKTSPECTLQSVLTNQENKIHSESHLNLMVERFVNNRKNIETNTGLEQLSHSLIKGNKTMEENIAHFKTIAGAVSQQDIHQYLNEKIEKTRDEIKVKPSLSQEEKQPSSPAKIKNSELEL